ncbi:hypothetical protein [Sediminitomix flava]|uniref:Lipoprotein n=1 Tax=Sediminitomix flava TaxID=379075 RepID=A0A315Z5Q0_SEDFL|nr:hypothetical protein [Sediminitomix flava]PWJ39177.1 hypothetical protein BC781_10678 [Sediminitomix flava]
MKYLLSSILILLTFAFFSCNEEELLDELVQQGKLDAEHKDDIKSIRLQNSTSIPDHAPLFILIHKEQAYYSDNNDNITSFIDPNMIESIYVYKEKRETEKLSAIHKNAVNGTVIINMTELKKEVKKSLILIELDITPFLPSQSR